MDAILISIVVLCIVEVNMLDFRGASALMIGMWRDISY